MTPDPALVAPASVNAQNVNPQGRKQHPPKPRWQRWAVALALISPVVFAISNDFPLCPSAGMLGLPCPGCGLTRATLLLAQGEFTRAFALHPLVIPLAPIYFGAVGLLGVELLRGPNHTTPSAPWLTQRWVSIFGGLVLVATVGLWGLRFFGYFGGPVPVQSYRDWAAAHSVKR